MTHFAADHAFSEVQYFSYPREVARTVCVTMFGFFPCQVHLSKSSRWEKHCCTKHRHLSTAFGNCGSKDVTSILRETRARNRRNYNDDESQEDFWHWADTESKERPLPWKPVEQQSPDDGACVERT